MEKQNWEKLEILVAKIQQSLAPEATVKHNVFLVGKESGVERQIDVLVSQKIGQYDFNIVIDCKDTKRPVDVKGIEEFIGLLKDVGGHKGALVCPSGFTAAARTRASKRGIELYSLVDTDPHKWQVKVSAPVVCKSRNMAVAFGLSFSLPLPFQLPQDFYRVSKVYNKAKEEIGTCESIFCKLWNEDKYPFEVGTHDKLDLIPGDTCLMDNGYGQIVPLDLYITYFVREERYWGRLSITDLSGLKDEHTGLVHSRQFTANIVSPNEVFKTWRKLKDDEALPAEPLFQMVITEKFDLRTS